MRVAGTGSKLGDSLLGRRAPRHCQHRLAGAPLRVFPRWDAGTDHARYTRASGPSGRTCVQSIDTSATRSQTRSRSSRSLLVLRAGARGDRVAPARRVRVPLEPPGRHPARVPLRPRVHGCGTGAVERSLRSTRALRRRVARADTLLAAGRLQGRREPADPTAGRTLAEPDLLALYRKAQEVQTVETNRKAHLQHGHEGPGGTLRPTDVER